MVFDQCRQRDTARQYRESVKTFLRSGQDPTTWTADPTVRANTRRTRWYALAALHAWCGRFPAVAGGPPRAQVPRAVQGPTLPDLLGRYKVDPLGLRGKLMVALAYHYDWRLAQLRDATLADLEDLRDPPAWLRELAARYLETYRRTYPDGEARRLFVNTRGDAMTRHTIAVVFAWCGLTTEQVRRAGRWARRAGRSAPMAAAAAPGS